MWIERIEIERAERAPVPTQHTRLFILALQRRGVCFDLQLDGEVLVSPAGELSEKERRSIGRTFAEVRALLMERPC